jgi:hypothetical protein
LLGLRHQAAAAGQRHDARKRIHVSLAGGGQLESVRHPEAQAQAEAAHHAARVAHLGEADSNDACGARLAPTAARLLDR